MTPSDIQWSRNLFDSLKENGTWAVPRSGIVFQKRKGRLHLITMMPYTAEMAEAARAGADVPRSAKELRKYQKADFKHIGDVFRAAGIEVVDDVSSSNDPNSPRKGRLRARYR